MCAKSSTKLSCGVASYNSELAKEGADMSGDAGRLTAETKRQQGCSSSKARQGSQEPLVLVCRIQTRERN